MIFVLNKYQALCLIFTCMVSFYIKPVRLLLMPHELVEKQRPLQRLNDLSKDTQLVRNRAEQNLV